HHLRSFGAGLRLGMRNGGIAYRGEPEGNMKSNTESACAGSPRTRCWSCQRVLPREQDKERLLPHLAVAMQDVPWRLRPWNCPPGLLALASRLARLGRVSGGQPVQVLADLL